MRVLLSIFDVQRFPKEALLIPEIFLYVSARYDSSVPSDLLRGIRSCFRFANRLTARLAAFPRSLARSLVPGFIGGVSKVLGRTDFIL